MAIQTLFPRISRTGRFESNSVVVPQSSDRTIRFMTNIHPADLANPNKYVAMMIDVEDASAPGGWRFDSGIPTPTQCGPIYDKATDTIIPVRPNFGFIVDTASLAGKTIRGVIEVRDNGPTGPFGSIRIGVTWEPLT